MLTAQTVGQTRHQQIKTADRTAATGADNRARARSASAMRPIEPGASLGSSATPVVRWCASFRPGWPAPQACLACTSGLTGLHCRRTSPSSRCRARSTIEQEVEQQQTKPNNNTQKLLWPLAAGERAGHTADLFLALRPCVATKVGGLEPNSGVAHHVKMHLNEVAT